MRRSSNGIVVGLEEIRRGLEDLRTEGMGIVDQQCIVEDMLDLTPASSVDGDDEDKILRDGFEIRDGVMYDPVDSTLEDAAGLASPKLETLGTVSFGLGV